MHKYIVYYHQLLLIALLSILITACGGSNSKTDENINPDVDIIVDKPVQSTDLTHFSFRHSNNPQLSSDIYVDINGNLLTARVNLNTPLDNLVATFEHDGETAYVNNVSQVSSTTSNDFTNIVFYTIETESGRRTTYQVVLTENIDENTPPAESTQNTRLTNFSFRQSNNPQLSSDINLYINGNLLSTSVNVDTPLANLIATFEHQGENVYVNGTAQVNSTTSNDFSNRVTYTIEAEGGNQESYQVDLTAFTGLPIIHLNIDDGGEITSKDDYIRGSVSINPNRNTTGLSDIPMKIRGRGNSTWDHPKKPYQMKLDDKAEFLGMPNDKKWLFLAEYSDKTLLRNTIAFEMGHISKLDWTPASTFAEVFINNQYNGTYNITQKVEESNNRVALGDTGYLLEIDQFDRLDADDKYFYSNDFLMNIKEPKLEFDSSEFNYIKNLIKDFEAALHGTQFKDPATGYIQHIDIDSFIDWYLISEITKNVDSKFFSSIYLNVKPGEKIKMGPLWDFDLTFGNTDYADSQYYYGFWVKDHVWYTRLFQDPQFVNKIRTRFAYFKSNQNYIIDKITQQAKYLDYAQQENDKKWQTMGIYVWPNAVVLDTYEQEVEHMKTWYINRMNWLESAFNNL